MVKTSHVIFPIIFDIARTPQDFGVGRLKNHLIAFDNINLDFSEFLQRRTPYPVKSASFFVLTLIRGKVNMNINLHDIEVHAGEMLVMTPGCIFCNSELSEDSLFYGLAIEDEFLNSIRKSLGFRGKLTQRYNSYEIKKLSQETIENNLSMYNLLCNELQPSDYPFKKEVIQRYCEIWALKNLAFDEQTEDKAELSKPFNRKEQIFHDFLTLLEQYYTRERSISFYADQLCLTSKYLSTTIKEVSGKHGMQWIDDYVALEAKALLKNCDLSVKQVSKQLNFPSQSMFGRFFKKMTGYSPKQYKFL